MVCCLLIIDWISTVLSDENRFGSGRGENNDCFMREILLNSQICFGINATSDSEISSQYLH